MIPPGATIGILGGGQLGRMTILAGRSLGYRFHVFDPSPVGPAAPLADLATIAPFNDATALHSFAASCDVVTFEFENVCAQAAAAIAAAGRPVRPSPQILHICQDRAREKQFLASNGFPHARFWHVSSATELADALGQLAASSSQGVLKTATSGYDGRGQIKVDAPGPALASQLWQEIGDCPCVLEEWVLFAAEASLIVARSPSGQTTCYPLVENVHHHHILHQTFAPSPSFPDLEDQARQLAIAIAASLDLEGLLAVELFVTADGRLLVNELAPRPHNSGHWSIDAAPTSQFEQLVRATCDLPLGQTTPRCPSVMTNLLGDLWQGGEPDWSAILASPDAHLHLYDKGEPRPGRKMGHFTLVHSDPAIARARADELFTQLAQPN
jgi:5-(carboxyamino)imidazole ribonucleotide synthase